MKLITIKIVLIIFLLLNLNSNLPTHDNIGSRNVDLHDNISKKDDKNKKNVFFLEDSMLKQ